MSDYRIDARGTIRWYQNNRWHRDDGPAIERTDGHKEWWFNGKCHRDDGPAIEYSNGTKEWWFNGKKYTEDEFVLLQFTNRKIVCPTQ